MSAHNDDIDAEFQSLVASLGETGTEASSQPTRDPDDTPVDESLHLEGGRLSVALVLAPIAYPEALHSLLALSGVRESIVRLKPWTAVWLRVETTPTDEEELDALPDAGCGRPCGARRVESVEVWGGCSHELARRGRWRGAGRLGSYFRPALRGW